MPVLYRASFGYLLRHPWQLALALFGICVGVAVMVAVDLANESSRKAFTLSIDAINGSATHQVIGGPSGVDEALYAALRTEAGMRNIAPVVSGFIEIGSETLQVLGVDIFAERDFRNDAFDGNDEASVIDGRSAGPSDAGIDLVRRMLAEPGALVLSRRAAARLGLQMDDEVAVTAAGRMRTAAIVGVFGSVDDARLDHLAFADIATAQHWFDMPGRLSRIDVRIDARADAQIEALEARLYGGTRLLTAAGRTRSTTDMSAAFMTNLSAMSLLALLVGVFLIYNSVSFAVLQRRGLIGILRALGLTRLQTFRLVITEAAVLGIVGVTLGLMLGIRLGEELLVLVSRTISDHYFVVNVTSVSLGALSITKGLLAGLCATLAAAIVPAIEAASYQPQLAMARSVLERRTSRLLPVITAIGIAAVALAAVLLLLPGDSLVTGLIALFLLIIGFALCIPVAARAAARFATSFGFRMGGVPGRLAISGVATSLSRTAVAIVALAVAVSATVGVSVMVGSFRDSVDAWLGSTLRSDVYVGVARGSIDPELIDAITDLPGIESVGSSRRVWLESEDGRTRLVVLRLSPGQYARNVRDADPDLVWRSFEDEGTVLVSDAYAYRRGVDGGDAVEILTDAGPQTFDIAGVYQSYDSNDGAIVMSRDAYERFFDDRRIDSLGLVLAPDVDPHRIAAEIRRIGAGRQALLVRSNAGLREISMHIFDRTFVITDVLYWLAVGVAIVGILGAMLALQLERARELAVLRALGMTPGQLGGMVAAQSGFIGLLSGIAALPLGLLMAWVLIEVINRRAFGWQIDMSIGPGALVAAVGLSVGAALVAGLYPAWRAAVATPALAMREE